ncbi:uncharacterized protein NECHADRAFT_21539, partial [Fusarium vanettenii 77-13-4]
RKRARKACLSCRARKVRCDVSQRGRPCTNCYLDDEPCVVTGRASKDCSGIAETVANLEPAGPTDTSPCGLPADPPVQPGPAVSRYTSALDDLPAFLPKPSHSSTSLQSHWPMVPNAPGSPELSYCCYPFLTLTNLHQIPQQDAAFLDTQGCFRVPVQPLLDELVQDYFLHIHPFLPLINEGDFWELYYHDPRYPPERPMSLLLLQAMLFAACTFISESASQALGYRDIRSMRATFLRRAKLLYDMECESSPLVAAQACVLLSFTSLSSSRKPNTLWLSLAIENAMLAEAHLYPTMISPARLKEKNVLKRLWWCCIIRDRSMSLLMRLPIRITKHHFDFNLDPLTSKDLEDELQRSKVYNPTTKLRLAKILAQSVELHATLTNILLLVVPPKGMQVPDLEETDESHVKLKTCKAALRRWHTSVVSESPKVRDPTNVTSSRTSSANHESIILYTNLMYMYYHTARIVLCHHEVLQLDILRASTGPSHSLPNDLSTIFETRRELQDANADIAECHKELLRLGLVQRLPSSAIGFIVLPLVLNILDVKLSPPPTAEPDQAHTSGATQQQLNTLIQFMRVYWPRYDGVEWVSEIIRHIIKLAQLDEPSVRRSSLNVNWADMFAFQPRSYLRLVLSLDLSLSKGRLPQDWDFPIKLR